MNKGLTISSGGVTYAELFAAIHADCFSEAWDEKAFKDLLNMPGAFSLIASKNENPVGFILCRSGGGECEVLTIGVLKKNQRHGVATSLLNAAIEEAQKNNAVSLLLEVAKDNTAAQELYRQNDFTEVGLRKGYYKKNNGSRVDALILKRAI